MPEEGPIIHDNDVDGDDYDNGDNVVHSTCLPEQTTNF